MAIVKLLAPIVALVLISASLANLAPAEGSSKALVRGMRNATQRAQATVPVERLAELPSRRVMPAVVFIPTHVE